MTANAKQSAAEAAKAAVANGSNGNGEKKLATVPKTLAGQNTTGITKLFNAYKLQVAAAIPKHITPERMLQVVTTIIANNDNLKACTTESLIGAMLACSIFGLEPISEFGQCYLIPYNNTQKGVKECQFQLGYRGMIQLMLRNPIVQDVYVEAVFKGDVFVDKRGLNRDIVHEPCGNEDPDDLTHVYAVYHTVNGGKSYVIMTRKNIERARDFSQAYKAAKRYNKATPWDDHLVAMAKKTALRQLFKYAPVATEVNTAVGIDGKVVHEDAAQQHIQGVGLGLDELLIGDDVEEVEVEDVTDAGDDDSNPAQATQAQILTIRKLAKEVAIDEMTEAELSEFLKSETKTAREADGWIAFLEKQKNK
ncbi:MAG: recombinase RecT [Calditrichaeota bacterium]|nr:recombinase RecT [Calditrichota bacterium]